MDKVVESLVALGVPGLVFLVAIATSGYAGGAAIVTALAFLGGPLGMKGGVAVLGMITLVSKAISQYGVEAIFKEVVKGLQAKGLKKDDIRKSINSYPITKGLKKNLSDFLDSL